jgi:hypothetical protein
MAYNGEALVLVDSAGSYYVLPKEVIEQAKVSDEAKGMVEEQVDQDTAGFMTAGLGFSFAGSVNLSAERFSAKSGAGIAWPCDATFSAGWPCDIPSSARYQMGR